MTTDAQRKELALVVPGDANYLHLIRDFVTAIARKMGFPERRVGEIEIAVDEACANIIEHGYRNAPAEQLLVARNSGAGAKDLHLRVSVCRDRIEVRILDQGPDFAPANADNAGLAEFIASGRKRGIGTYIIRNFMDEVRHAYHPGQGNELTLIKYLRAS